MTLEIVAVTGTAPVSMNVVDVAGSLLRATVYTGTCLLNSTATGPFAKRGPVQLGFYPDKVGAFVPRHSLTVHVEMGLAWMEVLNQNNGGRRRYGVADGRAQLVDDRHGNKVWPYVSFTALGGSSMELTYRLTVHEPLY